MDKQEFQKRLAALMELAQTNEKNLTKNQILETFGENQLSETQFGSLYEYLRIQGIRIQGMELKEQKETEEQVPLTPEDENCLKEYRQYLQEIKKEQEGERFYCLQEFRDGNVGMIERLAQLYLPQILSWAKKLYREGVYLEDLIQEGNMVLLSTQGKELPMMEEDEWMCKRIYEGMEAWVQGQTEQKLQDEYLVEKVKKLEAAIRELSDGEDQKFSVEELSAYLDMEEEEIRAVLRLTSEGNDEDTE